MDVCPAEVSMDDRLSKLPNSVVIHILSFLPTFDAVYRAGLVSKRLSLLKHSLPSLVFQINDFPSSQGCKYNHIKFRRYINDLLIFQDHDNLQRCCFHLPYNGYLFNHELDTWIKLVLHRKVKELELLFVAGIGNCYSLPRFLFRNEILTSLSLSYVGFKVGKEMKINWNSLKSLSMKHITDLDDDMLGKILIGCPILELLELNSCMGINKLVFVSQTLKELKLHDCAYSNRKDQRGEILRVSAPSLRVLVISGCNRYDKCILENLSSLVEATLDLSSFQVNFRENEDEYEYEEDDEFSDYDSFDDEEEEEEEEEDEEEGGGDNYGVIDFLERFRQVKKLTLLGIWNLHAQSIKCWPFLFSNCKTLTLDINLKQWELLGLAIMLQNCPELESLIIDMTTTRSIKMKSKCHNIGYEGKNFWMSNPNYVTLNCLLEHLKTVKIVGLQPRKGGELVVEFLQFILKHARVLERLFVGIDKSKSDCKCNKVNVQEDLGDEESIFQLSVFHMLLGFPRSSESAVIVVNSSDCNKKRSSNHYPL